MFPGAGAQVYYNEAGEPLGWDYPDSYEPDPYDDDRDPGPDEEPEMCSDGDCPAYEVENKDCMYDENGDER